MSKIWSTASIAAGGFGYDRALAAMFCGAKHGETVSQVAAVAALRGSRTGCGMCRLLHILVERNHCQIILQTDAETHGVSALRAGLVLLIGAALPLSLLCWAAWHLVFTAVLVCS